MRPTGSYCLKYISTPQPFVEHFLFCRNSSGRIRMTEGSWYPDPVKWVKKKMAAKVDIRIFRLYTQFLDLLVAKPDHLSNKMGKCFFTMSPVLCSLLTVQSFFPEWNIKFIKFTEFIKSDKPLKNELAQLRNPAFHLWLSGWMVKCLCTVHYTGPFSNSFNY